MVRCSGVGVDSSRSEIEGGLLALGSAKVAVGVVAALVLRALLPEALALGVMGAEGGALQVGADVGVSPPPPPLLVADDSAVGSNGVGVEMALRNAGAVTRPELEAPPVGALEGLALPVPQSEGLAVAEPKPIVKVGKGEKLTPTLALNGRVCTLLGVAERDCCFVGKASCELHAVPVSNMEANAEPVTAEERDGPLLPVGAGLLLAAKAGEELGEEEGIEEGFELAEPHPLAGIVIEPLPVALGAVPVGDALSAAEAVAAAASETEAMEVCEPPLNVCEEWAVSEARALAETVPASLLRGEVVPQAEGRVVCEAAPLALVEREGFALALPPPPTSPLLELALKDAMAVVE